MSKKKPTPRYSQLSVYPSVKAEIDEMIIEAERAGEDTNISRLIRRALMALREVSK